MQWLVTKLLAYLTDTNYFRPKRPRCRLQDIKRPRRGPTISSKSVQYLNSSRNSGILLQVFRQQVIRNSGFWSEPQSGAFLEMNHAKMY